MNSTSYLICKEPARQRLNRRYILISPCRDEAQYARQTIESIAAQTLRPYRWIIVDDGSTDDTPKILDEYARKLDYLQIVRREDRRERSVGPGVIDAFYAGLRCADLDGIDYICKLDLDLELPPRYFETLIHRMEKNPRIGTCSGKAYFTDPRTGQLVSERCGDETSVGMTKFYRVACFQGIGGFVPQVMWDGIDCHRCRMDGWIACSWDDPDLRFLHLRPMGTSDRGWWRGRMRHGFGQYFMGTGIVYMTVSALYRTTRPPVILGGLAMWWGYVWSLLTRRQRYDDPEFRRFLRRYQRDCLLLGKKIATERTNTRMAPAWSGDEDEMGPA